MCVCYQTLEWVCHPSENRGGLDESTEKDDSQPLCALCEDELGKSMILLIIYGMFIIKVSVLYISCD